uniref:Germinal center-associated signaling and motility protein n=1 Tax=Castor canadensis TaxID=51338 RepID=A0A8C0W045_CASCN
MGNYLQRGNYFRCWGCHTVKGCFCLPRKKISTSKARRDSPKENEGVTSVSIQDNANQTYSQELCYILINHRALGRKSSGSSAEVCYENVSCKAERPREPLGGTETEYSLLCVPSTPSCPPPPEDEYELLMPNKISFHSLQQPRPLVDSFETQFSCLQ